MEKQKLLLVYVYGKGNERKGKGKERARKGMEEKEKGRERKEEKGRETKGKN